MKNVQFLCAVLVILTVLTIHADCKFNDRRNYQQILLKQMFQGYDRDACPDNNPVGSNTSNQSKRIGTEVTFAAKLVRVIALNERGNTIRTQWWIQQKWTNRDLSWNPSHFGNVHKVYVSPGRVWTPDVLLYNSAEEDDRLGGGIDKYKTQIGIWSDGRHEWFAPALFKSTCDVNTRFFPFDDQVCYLDFGSWAFDSSQLDLHVDFNETGIKDTIYQANTEWELLDFKAMPKTTNYSCCPYPYKSIILEVHLRRRYFYYLVNLVIPCSLIAVMVLLSFILPPEAGERISLGITVLMAMAIFQELTSEKLPVESTHTPLLAQYYSSAIAEIGLALLATSVILNFHYRRSKMPDWLRKTMFTYLGPMVRIDTQSVTHRRDPKLLSRKKKNDEGKSNGEKGFRGNCELRSLNLVQNDTITNESNESPCTHHNNIRETHILGDGDVPAMDCEDHNEGFSRGKDSDNIDYYCSEWQLAAKILDRCVLLLAIVVSMCTFGAIFIQAPRVRAGFLGNSILSLEEKKGL